MLDASLQCVHSQCHVVVAAVKPWHAHSPRNGLITPRSVCRNFGKWSQYYLLRLWTIATFVG
jgi:hypothetical protein